MKQETRNDILSRKKEMTFFKVVRLKEFVTSLNDWVVFKCLCQLNDVKWHRYTSTHRKIKPFMNLIWRKFKIWNPFDIYVYVQNKTEYFLEVNFCWLGLLIRIFHNSLSIIRNEKLFSIKVLVNWFLAFFCFTWQQTMMK